MTAHVAGPAGPIPMNAGTYLHWGVVQISLANLIVIALMVTIFVIALLAPFPRRKR